MRQAPSVTKEDLVAFGYFSELASVPANAEKLILFASDIIMHLVGNNYNEQSDAHILAVKKAICCQVSYWSETGTNPINDSEASSYSLGELSVNLNSDMSGNRQSYSKLCPMAATYLRDSYLLYRGLRHGRR